MAPEVYGFVLYRGAGEDELVPGFVPQLVHGLALGCVVGFDALALIGDDQVCVEVQEGVEYFLSPGALVVDHRHLQVGVWEPLKVCQGLETLLLRSQQGADGVGEGCVILELFGPDGDHRGGGDDQHPADPLLLVSGSGHGDGRQGLAAAHLEEEAEAFIHGCRGDHLLSCFPGAEAPGIL